MLTHSTTSVKAPIKTRGLDHIKKSLSTTELSKQTIELISDDSRNNTISNYESAWKKVCSWLSEQKIDPFSCYLKVFIISLENVFYQKHEYNTKNLHKSAISACHDHYQSFSVGKHPKVKFNNKDSQ